MEWQEWLDDLHDLIREATKAANWVSDVVRRDINSTFFAVEGRFLLTEGPGTDLSFDTYLIEYTPEERQALPNAFLQKRSVKEGRATNWGAEAGA